MGTRRKAIHDVADLDALIEDITVDAHDVGEQLVGFECVIGELLDEPLAATVIGESVEVVSVHVEGEAVVGLRAVVKRGRRSYVVSLLDIQAQPDSELARYIAAYRRWAGLDSR